MSVRSTRSSASSASYPERTLSSGPFSITVIALPFIETAAQQRLEQCGLPPLWVLSLHERRRAGLFRPRFHFYKPHTASTSVMGLYHMDILHQKWRRHSADNAGQ